MTTPERRFCEFRSEGRRLMGDIMPYGEISPSHRERFEVRSLHPDSNVVLNLEHDEMVAIAWHPGGGLTLENDERSMRMVAELPPIPSADAALRYVRTGEVSGLSVEFVALRERRDADGIRVVEEAVLKGVGLVKHPSYDHALVEARARGRLATYRGYIPAKKSLECKCSPGTCEEAVFQEGALDDVLDADAQRDLLGILNEYADVFASRKKKSLRFWKSDRGLEIAVDVPSTAKGEAFLETARVADMIARPILDTSASEFVREGARVVYSKAHVRAISFSATDASKGWPSLWLKRGANDDIPETPKRRMRRWL